MPITRSARKALRSSLRKREFNRARKDSAAKAVKAVKKLIAENKKKEAIAALSSAQKALDKAAKGKTIKKNTASRRKAGLARLISKMS